MGLDRQAKIDEVVGWPLLARPAFYSFSPSIRPQALDILEALHLLHDLLANSKSLVG